MLKDYNDNDLLQKGVSEICVPFYQVWKELVDRRTLDVYQYRVLTSLSALHELDSVISKTLSGLFNSDANIESCREETLYCLNIDPVLDKHKMPLLNRLRAALGKNPKSDAEKKRLLYQIRYSIQDIDATYLELALSELKASIQNRVIGQIEQYSNIVVSQSVYNGWSTQALSDLLRFFRQNKAFDLQWRDFENELIVQSMTEHQVLINVPFRGQNAKAQEKSLLALERLGLKINAYDQIVTDYADIPDIKGLVNAEKKYFSVRVNAKDIYSAAHTAIKEISEQLNLASFYNLVAAWDLKSVVIVSINSQNKYHRSFTAEELYETHDYIDSSSRIFENTQQIFRQREKQTIRDKLQGAFSYTNISRASLFQEEKYMNLWVALESLSRTDMYSNIISNVRETVPAAIAIRYIYRVVRNFVEDCGRCRIDYAFTTRTIDMKQDSKQKLVAETLEVFRDPILFAELKSKCIVNSLLSHRIEEIHRIVTDVSAAKAKVENNYKRVSWQIQRLYRIRNEIAHSALREQTSLIVYIEHLYDYLSTYISELVTYLTEKRFSTIEEALCAIKDNYDVFISLATSADASLIENSTLKTGIINLL